eukprot:CAMPEP_0197685268 /NCGR_PEP_ID=MMETSP1338-20131121/100681_1 /TAXON_ID=43686 ORGANISM="Pelagodinium beii, Strain RCC1491" /NCGR_SAMPLE_ID=MMETSP1338 /ASSEMBLY_ACC=CAM_ASM_000754 /LENGTH=449 /DNA_ID=CAMNT_0043267071 /DNA_START=1 /DNA_END=1350 /DNA_ORIENTATION=-
MVKRRSFELVSALLIFLNASIMGIQLQHELENPTQDTIPFLYRFCDTFFVVIFTLELVIRLAAHRLWFYHWKNRSIMWNLFDTGLVSLSYVELFLAAIAAESQMQGFDLSVMRLFRILRLVRSFRIIRVVKVFRDLRLMLGGIFHAFKSLLWAALLLFAIMYLIAVCLLNFALQEYQVVERGGSGTLTPKQYQSLKEYWPNLLEGILTLYKSITGGCDWADPAAPIFAMGSGLGFIFVSYIAFAVLCVLNIITGNFVENANRLTAQDTEMVMMEQMQEREGWIKQVRAIFKAADVDNSNALSKDEFIDKMKDVKLQSMLRKVGVEIESQSAEGLFKLLDFDEDESLDIDEFAMALSSIHGNAKSIDLARVRRDARLIRKEVQRLGCILDEAYQKNPVEAYHVEGDYEGISKRSQSSESFKEPKPQPSQFQPRSGSVFDDDDGLIDDFTS